MKLASFKDGSRDGQLLVVSRDLTTAHFATGVATRLQQVLDDWNFLSPQLEDLYTRLNQGKARHAFTFDPRLCMAPLPRAYEWVHGSAFGGPIASPDPAPPSDLPSAWREEPLLRQGGSDDFLGPRDELVFGPAARGLAPPGRSVGKAARTGGTALADSRRPADSADRALAANTPWGVDFSPGLGVITGDVAEASTPAAALDSVRLLVLVNSWRLRAEDLPPGGDEERDEQQNERQNERQRERLTERGEPTNPHQQAPQTGGPRGIQKRPVTSFGPVAVTPDELGDAWRGGRVHLNIETQLNAKRLGACAAADGMRFHFGELLAHRTQTRRVCAGALVGSGTLRAAGAARGFACIADQRALETREQGTARTAYLQAGDRVRIDVKGRDGHNLFGGIDQTVRWDEEGGAAASPAAGVTANTTTHTPARDEAGGAVADPT